MIEPFLIINEIIYLEQEQIILLKRAFFRQKLPLKYWLQYFCFLCQDIRNNFPSSIKNQP